MAAIPSTGLLLTQPGVALPRVPHRPSKGTLWLLKAHEALLGRRTFDLYRALRQTERCPEPWSERLQLLKLQRLLNHAATHTPYYRDRGLQPDSIRSLDDLERLPLLTRDDLRRHASAMCWQAMPARRLVDTSSGTSDEPVRYFWDRRRQAWDRANRLRAHAWHGFEPIDRELHLWPVDPPRTAAARLRRSLRQHRDTLLGEWQIDSLALDRSQLAAAWHIWRRFDPARVSAYPSALTQFIRDARRMGCRLHSPSLRRVFLTGEVLHAWQRSEVEHELGVPVSECYGVQEAGAIAFECPQSRWHVSAESAIVEIVRHGRRARPGDLGEIVVTGLESLAMPVLRYCTGDIARAEESVPCPCGRTLPVMPRVLGRLRDFLRSNDGRWIEPTRAIAAIGQVLAPGTFSIRQNLADRIEVDVIDGPQPCPDWKERVRAGIMELVGPAARCTVRRVSALDRSMFGKCRYTDSETSRLGLAQR